MDSTDLSPSTVEFLEKEKICLDEHKNSDDDGVDCSRKNIKVCTSTVSGVQDQEEVTPSSSSSSSDDEIGSLLMKMKELLSPRDLEYLRSNEGKNVEDLLKETEEFIQNSSSLFHNLSFNSSSTGSSAGMITYPEKSNEPNEHVEILMKEMEKVAEETSCLVSHVVTSVSASDNEDHVSPTVSGMEKLKITEGEIDSMKLSKSDHKSISKDCDLKDSDEATSNSSDNNLEIIDNDNIMELVQMDGDSDSDSSKENYQANNTCITENENSVNVPTENDSNHNLLSGTNENNSKNKSDNVNIILPLTQLTSQECELITDLNAKNFLTSPKDNMPNYNNGDNDINCNTVTNEDNLQQFKVALHEAESKHKTEIELLRKKYEDEILRLKEHINTLNAKLINYESDATWKETGGGDNKRITRAQLEDKKIQELEAEIKKQDHLIAGYQRENQKLFADITAAKVNIHGRSSFP